MPFNENRPIYLQIADRLADEMMRGVYSEGQRIPSVREYAALLGVNPNTVVRAYDYLQSRDIIFNKRGLGYFVADGAVDAITRMSLAAFRNDELPQIVERIRALGISPEQLLEMITNYSKD